MNYIFIYVFISNENYILIKKNYNNINKFFRISIMKIKIYLIIIIKTNDIFIEKLKQIIIIDFYFHKIYKKI